jgi:hypothetical protein
MITRRNFVGLLGLTTIGALSQNPLGKAFAQTLQSNDDLFSLPAESLSDPVLSFTSAHFTPFVNTDFAAKAPGARRTVSLRLLNVKEVQRKGNLAKGVGGDSFSLMFAATRGAQIAGNSYEFTHASLGVFSLVLIPVSAEPNRFEAIINHLRR